MDGAEFTIEHDIAIKRLDEIDLKPFLVSGENLWTVREAIDAQYKEFDLFNCINQDDFRDYLQDRYKIRIQEITSYYI